MTSKTRQNWSIAGQLSTVVALLAIASGLWKADAGFTTATIQHEQIFQQNAEIFRLLNQNSEEQLKVLRRIEEKLDTLNRKERDR